MHFLISTKARIFRQLFWPNLGSIQIAESLNSAFALFGQKCPKIKY